jgi:hypothetical protein
MVLISLLLSCKLYSCDHEKSRRKLTWWFFVQMWFINGTITGRDLVKRTLKIKMVKKLSPWSHYSTIIGVETDWPHHLWTLRASCFPLKKQQSPSLSLSRIMSTRHLHIYLLASNHPRPTANLKVEKPKIKKKNKKKTGHLSTAWKIVSRIQNLPPFTFLLFIAWVTLRLFRQTGYTYCKPKPLFSVLS